MTKAFSMGEVHPPTQLTIVNGFHRYTVAAISPSARFVASIKNQFSFSETDRSEKELFIAWDSLISS